MYLTGRISSIGSGWINVLEGAYDISVTDNVVKDPNLKGKDIILNVKGSVGLNSDKDVAIDLNGLYDVNRLDDLKALTSGDASSVTWDEKNKQAVINQKYPLGVQLASGYELEYIPGLHHYNRFDNYDLPEFDEHAAEDELRIE